MGSDFVVRGHCAIKRGIDIEDAAYTADPGENAILPGEHGRGCALIWIDAGIARRIARGTVFEQCIFENRGDASAAEVHNVDVLLATSQVAVKDVASYVST